MAKQKIIISLALSAIALAACGKTEEVRNRISIVGSSTVFPFSSAVAEQFGTSNSGMVPKVESTGTGGGIKIFCSGTGLASVDIANASRQMKKSEYDECQKNGVKEIVEVKIGYDGIVLATAKSGPDFALSRKDLYLALAKEVPVNGVLAPNPYKSWNEVNPKLPNVKIDVMGPPPTSGTRDAFAEMILEKGAQEVDVLKKLHDTDKEAFKKAATSIREDGVWKDMGENDNLIVQALTRAPITIGIFGYSFFEENKDKVKAAKIENKLPELASVVDGSYPASRSLYFYVKKTNISMMPSIKNYMQEFTSEKAMGTKGYLIGRGLVPLNAEESAKQRANVESLAAMIAPEK